MNGGEKLISLRHYLIFRTVAETESFTKAAQRLFITQSAVSHTIKEMEESMGTPLFERLSKHIYLTSCGKLLLEEVVPLLAAYESLEKRLGQLERKAPVHLVSSITIASFWLPDILRTLKGTATPFYVKVVPAAEAVQVLLSGKADLALIEGVPPDGPFISTKFSEYDLKVVCAPDYLYKKDINIRDFCMENLLLREQGSAIRDVLDSQLYLQNIAIHPVWESVNSSALIQAAKAGLGLTVLPEVLVHQELLDGVLCAVDVDGLSLQNNLYIVWHKDKSITPVMKLLISKITGKQ